MAPRRPAQTSRVHSRTPKPANPGGKRTVQAAGSRDRNQRRSAQIPCENNQPESPAARSGVFDYGQTQWIGCHTLAANYARPVISESVWIPGVHVDTATIITGAHIMMQRALAASLFLAACRKISVPLNRALCMADLVAFLKSIGEMK